MSKYRILTPFLLGALLLVAACQYDPDGDIFVDLEPPNDEGVEINLENATIDLNDIEDTVSFFRRTDLRFNVDLEGRRVVESTLTVNQTDLPLNQTSRNQFTVRIDPNDFGTGVYNLRMTITANSGTGSLADRSQMETITVQRSWIMIIDLEAPGTSGVDHVAVENGFMKISWPKYERTNFQEYEISKFCYYQDAPDEAQFCGRWTIEDQNQVTLVDSSHLQGDVAFMMKIKAADKYSFGSLGLRFNIPAKFGIEARGREDGLIELRWTKPYLENAFSHYYLESSRSRTVDFLERINQINDTVRVYDPGLIFGSSIRYIVNTFGVSSTNFNRITQEITTEIGVKIPTFTHLDTSPHHNSIYFENNTDGESLTSLVRADATTLSRSDSIVMGSLPGMDNEDFHELVTTTDGQRLFVLNRRVLHELNPLTLELIDTYDLSGFGTAGMNTTEGFAFVSDNGFLKVHIDRTIYIYDLNNRKLTFEVTIGATYGTLSSDAEWLIVLRTIWKRSGDTYVNHAFYGNPSARSLGFLPNGTQFFKNSTSNTIEIKDLETVATVSETPFEDDFNLGREATMRFDKLSKTYYFGGDDFDDFISLFSAEDQSRRFVPAKAIRSEGSYFIAGNRIFSKNGYYKSIQ